MLKKGDKVCLRGREEITGEVIDVKIDNLWGVNFEEYLIKYDDDTLIPPQDWHEIIHLEKINKLPSGIKKVHRCECGVDKVMPNGRHSDYCPLYKEYK